MDASVTVSGSHEIQLPVQHVVINVPEETEEGEPPATEEDQITRRKLVNLINLSKDDALNFDRLQTQADGGEASGDRNWQSPQSPTSPSSIYTVGGSVKHPHLQLKPRSVSTRQCKFEIGEEWEQFQTIHTTKSISCPPSPLMGGRKSEDGTDGENGRTNPGYAASEPGAEIEQDLSDSAIKGKEPFPFHFLFNAPTGSKPKHFTIMPNPHNRINQRFHSTLQCPCFLFFFFLCCLPAVHFMQQSDRQFKKGNTKRALNYGKLSTVFYVLGSVIGVTFLSVAIYFAADYVRQYV